MGSSKPEVEREKGESHGGHAGGGIFVPDGHGEELREIGEQKFPNRRATLDSVYAQLSVLLGHMIAQHKEPEKPKHEALAHPLVFAAVITGVLTLGSAYFAHAWQEKSAQNERAASLLKTKLEFATSFGDHFPRTLNLTYRATKSGLWLDYNASLSADDPARTRESATFADLRAQLVEAKKPAALLAPLTALFGASVGEAGTSLWNTVRDIQNLRDDTKGTLEDKLKLLEGKHEEANKLFIEVMQKIGAELRQ